MNKDTNLPETRVLMLYTLVASVFVWALSFEFIVMYWLYEYVLKSSNKLPEYIIGMALAFLCISFILGVGSAIAYFMFNPKSRKGDSLNA